ncbi:MAG: RNA polymerase subunit sigma [Bacteroidetes bacterium]|nr:MAG: RNA polymerase subunit sigma [Bacteroidota bacterium]
MPQYTDQEIIDLCRSSQTRERGFRVLLSQYKERIYWHIRRILYDHEDANDVTQDVFIKVWKSLDSFRGDSKLFSWIYRIATNESINYFRKMQKKKNIPLDKVSQYLESKVQYENISGEEIERRLHNALVKLPEKQRLVFNMKYFDDLKYREIAQILNITEGSLKASYHYAVKKIEENLKQD